MCLCSDEPRNYPGATWLSGKPLGSVQFRLDQKLQDGIFPEHPVLNSVLSGADLRVQTHFDVAVLLAVVHHSADLVYWFKSYLNPIL